MELPKLKKQILPSPLNPEKKDNSTLICLRFPTPQEKYSKIYNLQGNQNATLLLNYTQRMEKFKSHFNQNRLVRCTKHYIDTRRKITSLLPRTPTPSNHLNSYKLSYSP
jgi:hypothetical protein